MIKLLEARKKKTQITLFFIFKLSPLFVAPRVLSIENLVDE